MKTPSLNIQFQSNIENIQYALNSLDEFCYKNSVPDLEHKKLLILTDEILSNIIKYGKLNDDSQFISFSCKKTDEDWQLEFEDRGIHFDPANYLEQINYKEDPDEIKKVGGLGLKIVNNFLHSMDYHRRGEKNYLRLKIKFINQ
ncbi:MAG: ATP-binding protein [Saprospiraceae bacterium]